MRILARADVERALPMREAVAVVRRAFAQLSTGRATVPLRISIEEHRHQGVTLFMPGYLVDSDALAIKIASVHRLNPGLGLPLIHALVVLLEPSTGRPLAAIEGSSLTALRTGAASGVATELLAREDSNVVAIFGAGVQARAQLLAVCAVRAIRRARIYAPRPGQVDSFIDDMKRQLGPSVELLAATSQAETVRDADVICTATTAITPVFDGADLRAGTHVNGVGSFTPQMQEVDFTTLGRAAKIVVDSRAGALCEAGDLVRALERRVISRDDIYGEIGEIAAGLKPGRENDEEITFFKSVGNAALDVAVAQAIYSKALESGLGVEIAL